MAKRPTVYDVAEDAGVSIATVSFAFAKPEKVRAETLRTVLASAARLGYVPSANARGLAKGHTRALGLYSFDYLRKNTPQEALASPDRDDGRLFPLYADVIQRGVELECLDQGYALMLGAGSSAPNRAPVVDVAGRVDGLITFVGAAHPDLLQQVARRIPVIQLGGEAATAGTHTVLVDGTSAMHQLADHLLTVHGYRDIAFVGDASRPEFRQRLAGLTQRLVEAGLAAPPVLPGRPDINEVTTQTIRRLVECDELPDALVCSTDQEALAVLDALRSAGKRAPEDVAVTGFDGILAGRLSEPTLTTLRQPMETVGRTAVQLMTTLIDGGSVPEQGAGLECTLTIGHSCGC
jgi:DNA-binding LacI/PurR family transcriptional regulator